MPQRDAVRSKRQPVPVRVVESIGGVKADDSREKCPSAECAGLEGGGLVGQRAARVDAPGERGGCVGLEGV